MVNPIFQQDEELLLNPFGSKYLPSGTYTDVNSNQFVVQEDAVISVLTGGDASIAENNIDYKASMSLSGVTLKKGALIVAPVREAFKSITIDSGAIMAYNCVVKGQKAVPFVGLLDLYPDAAAAYSLRKLRADYTGDAIRVRIDIAGGDFYDIGFDSNGELDTADLLSKAAGNDACIHTWYDQSGEGNDAIQVLASNQGKIVDLGNLIINPDNSLPAIDVSSTYIFMSTTPMSTKNLFAVAKMNQITSTNYFAFSASPFSGMYYGGTANPAIKGIGLYAVSGGINSLEGEDLSTHLANFYHNDTTYLVSKDSETPVGLGAYSKLNINQILGRDLAAPTSLNGFMQEMIIYSTGDDSNNEAIKSNINSHYNIY